MSFIEKNKVWLLPLLGLGILGVGYMNFRTFTETPGTATPEAGEAEAASAPPEPSVLEAPPAEPAGEEAPPEEGSAMDLWADLHAFSVLPGILAQEGALKDRARVALSSELEAGAPQVLEKPSRAALARPARTASVASAAPVAGAAPQLEFLIHGPGGSFAWFDGRAYRAGEALPESGYTVSRIGPTFVELLGPEGRILEYTNPFGKKPSHPVEAP